MRDRRDRPARGDRQIGHDSVRRRRAGTRSTGSGRGRSRPRAAARAFRRARRSAASNRGETSRPYTSGRAFRYPTAPRRTRFVPLTARRRPTSRDAWLEPAVALDRLLAGGADVAANLFERRAAPPLGRLVFRRHRVDIVGADGERDLRELGSVQRPVHLNRRHVVHDDPRQRHALHIVVAGASARRSSSRRGSGANARMTATARCSSATAFSSGRRIGRRRLMHGQARERQPGDIHFLDRPPRILQAIERRFGDQLEAGGAQLFEQRSQRDAVARGQRLPDRRAKTRRPTLPCACAITCRTRSTAAARVAGAPTIRTSPAAGGNRHRRTRVGRNVGDADKGRVQRVPLRGAGRPPACRG